MAQSILRAMRRGTMRGHEKKRGRSSQTVVGKVARGSPERQDDGARVVGNGVTRRTGEQVSFTRRGVVACAAVVAGAVESVLVVVLEMWSR